MLTGMLHMHVSSWSIGILLFIVSFILLKMGKMKAQKITHMILRLFYILIVASGGTLIALVTSKWGFPGEYVVKTILGLIVISMMELILVKAKDGVKTGIYWIIFILSFIVILFYGYSVLRFL